MMNSTLVPMANSKSSPPLLRLPAELHLDIVSYLQDSEDFAVLQFRRTNRYFHHIIHAPTHDTLLRLELSSFAKERSLYTCKYCLRLRHASKFATTMLKGKTGLGGTYREKRFCAECGFDTTKAQRYLPGQKATVDGICWKWCKHCKLVKKGEAAGPQACTKMCKACYDIRGCICGLLCVKKDTYTAPTSTALARKSWTHSPVVASDMESAESADEYDWCYYYANLDDNDWPAFN